jgi:hypothetical protein
MASRKEQKEALRREREQREAQAKAGEKRRRMIGYGAGGALVVAVVAVLAVLLLSGGGGGGSGNEASASSDVLPDGGSVPETRLTDLQRAAEEAGCELSENPATSRDHSTDPAEEVEYEQNPPNSGRHFQIEAQDGAYEDSPRPEELVHSLEHGRVVVWFDPELPEDARADLKAFYDDDEYQMLLAPKGDMPSAVAATAWGAEPQPLGTGYSLTCSQYDERVFDALRAFRDEHRSNGPEPIP